MAALTRIAHDTFYKVETKRFRRTNNFLATLTLLSVFAIVLETVPSFEAYTLYFLAIEYTAVFFFTLEYLGRILAHRGSILSYVFSFFGIIDLLSIVPTYAGLTNLTFLKTARVLRILRLLRIIRLAKVARIKRPRKKDLEDYGYVYRLNVQIYFFALIAAVTIFGTLIYIVESDTPAFSSIPLGMLWAVKPLLGGIAQELPQTALGELISVFARFTGLILFGLLIAIVGNTVRKLLLGTDDLSKN